MRVWIYMYVYVYMWFLQRNTKSIEESFEKNKYEKCFASSEYSDQKKTNDLPTFSSDIIMDINLKPLPSNLTFICTKWDKSQDDKRNKVIKHK